MGTVDRFRRFLYQGFIPVTKSIMLLSGIVFLGLLILPRLNIHDLYYFSVLTPAGIFRFPWTLITYPFVNSEPLGLIFALIWLWFVGGSLERSWGSWTFGIFLFFVTLVTGAVMVVAGLLFNLTHYHFEGLWLILVAPTWAWARIIPDQEVLFWGIIPMRLKWLAWISAGFALFQYFPNLLLGLASISGIMVVYFFQGSGPYSRGFRKWTWKLQGFSLKRWLEERRQKSKRNKFKVIKH